MVVPDDVLVRRAGAQLIDLARNRRLVRPHEARTGISTQIVNEMLAAFGGPTAGE
jgi:hypothetical protein